MALQKFSVAANFLLHVLIEFPHVDSDSFSLPSLFEGLKFQKKNLNKNLILFSGVI